MYKFIRTETSDFILGKELEDKFEIVGESYQNFYNTIYKDKVVETLTFKNFTIKDESYIPEIGTRAANEFHANGRKVVPEYAIYVGRIKICRVEREKENRYSVPEWWCNFKNPYKEIPNNIFAFLNWLDDQLEKE